MANLNKIILVGRLTADPEMRTTLDATPITKFQLAVDRNRPAGMPKETDFMDIIAWRKLAEICGNYLTKGQLVLVEGRIQNRSFETKEGAKRYVTEIVANSMTMLEKGKGKAAPAAIPQETVADEVSEEDFLEDDLPF